jgi:hypothetical protein
MRVNRSNHGLREKIQCLVACLRVACFLFLASLSLILLEQHRIFSDDSTRLFFTHAESHSVACSALPLIAFAVNVFPKLVF